MTKSKGPEAKEKGKVRGEQRQGGVLEGTLKPGGVGQVELRTQGLPGAQVGGKKPEASRRLVSPACRAPGAEPMVSPENHGSNKDHFTLQSVWS